MNTILDHNERSDITIAPGPLPGLERIVCSPAIARKLCAAAEIVIVRLRLGTGDASTIVMLPLSHDGADALLADLWLPQLELLRYDNSITIQTM